MKMPGFTAEVSIYEPTRHYRMIAAGSSASSAAVAAAVLPQLHRCCNATECWYCWFKEEKLVNIGAGLQIDTTQLEEPLSERGANKTE